MEITRNGGGTVAVRDSVHATEGAPAALLFGAAEWRRFVGEIKHGRFDRP